MRYGIFADVHGNWEALNAVIAALAKESIEGYLCVGDIVGYGANPCECVERVRELKAVVVAGNHDWAAVGKMGIHPFNPLARDAVLWTQKQLGDKEIQFLKDLPLVFQNDELIMVHGTLLDPQRFRYLSGLAEAEKTFTLLDRPLCFLGHTHIAEIIQQGNGHTRYSTFLFGSVEPGHKMIVNVGSVGQPRDGNPQAAYCILDTEKKKVEIKHVFYDIKEAQRKILEAGLPPELATRLSAGY